MRTARPEELRDKGDALPSEVKQRHPSPSREISLGEIPIGTGQVLTLSRRTREGLPVYRFEQREVRPDGSHSLPIFALHICTSGLPGLAGLVAQALDHEIKTLRESGYVGDSVARAAFASIADIPSWDRLEPPMGLGNRETGG